MSIKEIKAQKELHRMEIELTAITLIHVLDTWCNSDLERQ